MKSFSLNMQPIEKSVEVGGSLLDMVNIWFTIQGEGPYAGRPAVFVRLAGCNLQCPACDTNYTALRDIWRVDDLAKQVLYLWRTNCQSRDKLLVITGGEPFRQPIELFVKAMVMEPYNFLVQIETNGTLYRPDMPWNNSMDIVCSPKTGQINRDLVDRIRWLKYILRAGEIDPADGLPTSVLGNGIRPWRPPITHPRSCIYVQPMDEGDDAERTVLNVNATVKMAMKFGYTLSLQQHKIVGLE